MNCVETTLRKHFETIRLAVAGPGRDSEGLSLTHGYAGWNTNVASRGSPSWPEPRQAIRSCELDRAGTNGVTSLALKDSRQRQGDEPVSEEQRSWLRSLSGVMEHPTTDMPNLQYLSRIS